MKQHEHRMVIISTVCGIIMCLASLSISAHALTSNEPLPPSDSKLDKLWETMRSISSFQASFSEEKELSILKEPLRSSGILFYNRPNLLVRKIESPSRQLIWISENVLVVRHLDLQTEETLDLEQQPAAAQIVRQFLWLFQGNKNEIQSHYDLQFKDLQTELHLVLHPVKEPMSLIAKELKFVFKPDFTPSRFEMMDLSGDKSTLTFLTVIVNHNIESVLKEIAPDLHAKASAIQNQDAADAP